MFIGTPWEIIRIHVSTRLYPTGLIAGSRTAWRAAVNLRTPDEIAQADTQLFWLQGSCEAWASMDRLVYEYRALDEMIFGLADTGSGGAATCV
ncbi:hypothetical protein F4781DRAFT_388992 [Annulohypoxylon bovei var. microspora]|nr:hypothetical protein F4781DRAFT_388992 [Annulohypoxylon bovei var. microspora]